MQRFSRALVRLLFTVVVSMVSGIAFGLAPALRLTAMAPARMLQNGTRVGLDPRRLALQRGLVAAEVALSLVLLVGAAMAAMSFSRLSRVDVGFDPTDVVTFRLAMRGQRYEGPEARVQLAQDVVTALSGLPGVEAAAIAGNHPLDPGFTNSWTVVGREAEAATWPEISVRRVTEGYFDTVGVPLVEGRAIEAGDTTSSAPVVVINEAARARFFPDGPALGHEVRLWGTARRIVGIVGNEKFQGLTAAAPIALYAPLSQTPSTSGAGVLLAGGLLLEPFEVLARDPLVRLRRPDQEDAALEREQELLDPETDMADQECLRGRDSAAQEVDEHELAHAFAGRGGDEKREQGHHGGGVEHLQHGDALDLQGHGVAEVHRQAHGGVRRDRALAVDQFVDAAAGDAQRIGEFGLADVKRLQVPAFEKLAGMRRATRRHADQVRPGSAGTARGGHGRQHG